MLASEKYEYTTDKTFKVYSFVSDGPKGSIHKIAKFNEVVIQGTNTARTRLYQMYINKYWARIEPVFVIDGLNNEKWESFKKGKNYAAFLGRRKAK
jgi:hypothetical protein